MNACVFWRVSVRARASVCPWVRVLVVCACVCACTCKCVYVGAVGVERVCAFHPALPSALPTALPPTLQISLSQQIQEALDSGGTVADGSSTPQSDCGIKLLSLVYFDVFYFFSELSLVPPVSCSLFSELSLVQ